MTYLILMAPVILFSLWASFKVKSTFAKFSRLQASCGLTGSEAAAYMLRANGLQNVRIERVSGFLSDHYDPKAKCLRLSPEVHDGHSVSALGVACHEAGHALQHAQKYAPLELRSLAVPTASFGSWLAFPLIIIGFAINSLNLAWVGVILFSAVVLFQIITLPVEFNASSRAKSALVDLNMVLPGREASGVSSVLNAAAMTYVAAAISAIFTLLYYVMLLTGRRD